MGEVWLIKGIQHRLIRGRAETLSANFCGVKTEKKHAQMRLKKESDLVHLPLAAIKSVVHE